MIKTHNITGLKYLCYTQKEDYISYLGSGTKWRTHLKKYGEDISTELIFESDIYEEFKKIAIYKSLEFDIVNSKEWANKKLEEGDGGDTVSNKKWITNGIIDKYIDKNEILPENWKYGRSKCVFNDSNKQKEFNKRVDQKNKGNAIKLAWKENRVVRDHSKCGTKGDKNPSKRKEIREKIKQWQLNKPKQYCEECNLWFGNIWLHLNRSKKHNDSNRKD